MIFFNSVEIIRSFYRQGLELPPELDLDMSPNRERRKLETNPAESGMG